MDGDSARHTGHRTGGGSGLRDGVRSFCHGVCLAFYTVSSSLILDPAFFFLFFFVFCPLVLSFLLDGEEKMGVWCIGTH